MGKIKQGILGGFSGKVGAVIGSSWKGKAVMRGITQHTSNPQSPAQLRQRLKFSVAMHFLVAISQFLKTGWGHFAIGMTAMNAAFSYTIKNALLGTYPDFTIDYPNVLVTKGILAPALNQAAASTIAGTVLFTWDDNSDEMNASPFDKNLLVVYNPVKNQAVTFSGLGERADGTQSVTVPNSFSGDLVHCFIAFETLNGSDISNSKYAGVVTVA